MGFSIWNILKATLLVVNAMAILNKKRFIDKYFLGGEKARMDQFSQYGVDPSTSRAPLVKQIGDLFSAASYLRVPLILFNCLVIFMDMLFG